MPRLIGKPSKAPVYLGITILLAATVGLEYFGDIDAIPGFGRDGRTTGASKFHHSSFRDPMAPRL